MARPRKIAIIFTEYYSFCPTNKIFNLADFIISSLISKKLWGKKSSKCSGLLQGKEYNKKDISIKSFVTRSNIHVMRNDNLESVVNILHIRWEILK